MLHYSHTHQGKRRLLLSLSVLILSAGNVRAQNSCCTETETYGHPTNDWYGWYLCMSKTVPTAYQCTSCSTAVNCKWLHFDNESFLLTGDPPQITGKCCYTKFKLRIYKDPNSSDFSFCNISNNWDCKTECNNNWTISKVIDGQEVATLTEGNCVAWGTETYWDIWIYPTNDQSCEDGCYIDAGNHFLATICGVSDIEISFDYIHKAWNTFTQQWVTDGNGTCGAYTYDDDNISTDSCPDTDDPCY